MEQRLTDLGTQIKVNNGEIETLIKVERPYGLYESQSGYKVVRNLMGIKQNQIIKWKQPAYLMPF